jgi:hypothetical protein
VQGLIGAPLMQVEASSKQLIDKWVWFAVGVLPAPLIAGPHPLLFAMPTQLLPLYLTPFAFSLHETALCPGVLSFKAIICAAVAAAQAVPNCQLLDSNLLYNEMILKFSCIYLSRPTIYPSRNTFWHQPRKLLL